MITDKDGQRLPMPDAAVNTGFSAVDRCIIEPDEPDDDE
jgi:hypothetical protein